VDLTPQEYELLDLFTRNPNIALTREQMLNAAWGYDFMGSSRTVDMHVQKLRKKLGWENTIKTVYKLGYRLEI
jgi:DNA-binding response OmpR family regulator